MKRFKFLFLLLIVSLPSHSIRAQTSSAGIRVRDDQSLYNGRLWRFEHPGINGNPFLFTDGFLEGTVNINGRSFDDLLIRYDGFADEIMIPAEQGILKLNKELTDSFTLKWNNKVMRFVRIPEDSSYPFSGYVRILYSGTSALYIKYQKKIDRPRVENAPDSFFEIRRMYLVYKNSSYLVKNKREFLDILKDNERINSFIKENKIRLNRRNPESFVPVLDYLDRISM